MCSPIILSISQTDYCGYGCINIEQAQICKSKTPRTPEKYYYIFRNQQYSKTRNGVCSVLEIGKRTWSFKGSGHDPLMTSTFPLIRNCSQESVKYQHIYIRETPNLIKLLDKITTT